jgi:hypothetical protein
VTAWPGRHLRGHLGPCATAHVPLTYAMGGVERTMVRVRARQSTGASRASVVMEVAEFLLRGQELHRMVVDSCQRRVEQLQETTDSARTNYQ